MKISGTMLIVFIFIFAVLGCAAKQKTTMGPSSVQSGNNIKTVSVETFKCSDPLIAQNMKNKIVESLLADYSVVIGDRADVTIVGTVTLKNKIVSEIKAEIRSGNEVLTAVSVGQSSTDNSSEAMGMKMGEKLRNYLSGK